MNQAVCRACPGECLDACFNDAIAVASGGGVFIDEEFCAGCGACIPACGIGNIRLHQGVARLIAVEPNEPDAVPIVSAQPE